MTVFPPTVWRGSEAATLCPRGPSSDSEAQTNMFVLAPPLAWWCPDWQATLGPCPTPCAGRPAPTRPRSWSTCGRGQWGAWSPWGSAVPGPDPSPRRRLSQRPRASPPLRFVVGAEWSVCAVRTPWHNDRPSWFAARSLHRRRHTVHGVVCSAWAGARCGVCLTGCHPAMGPALDDNPRTAGQVRQCSSRPRAA